MGLFGWSAKQIRRFIEQDDEGDNLSVTEKEVIRTVENSPYREAPLLISSLSHSDCVNILINLCKRHAKILDAIKIFLEQQLGKGNVSDENVKQMLFPLGIEEISKILQMVVESHPEIIDELKDEIWRIRCAIKTASAMVALNVESSSQPKEKEVEVPKPERETAIRKIESESEYIEFINGLGLNNDQKEKLNCIVRDFDEAVATVREFDPSIIVPKKEDIISKIVELGYFKLRNIAMKMERPALIITPSKMSLRRMKNAMDMNKHFEDQNNALLDDNYGWCEGNNKVGVSIVDMEQCIKPICWHNSGQRPICKEMEFCEEEYQRVDLRLVYDYEYMVAMQRSLRMYEMARERGEERPERYILDYSETFERITETVFHQAKGSKNHRVATGCFSVARKRVRFQCYDGSNPWEHLRGRSAVTVM